MSISIRDLLKLDNASIIDLRSIEKYNDNHMPGAKNIPTLLLLKSPEKYLDKFTTYYLYCQKGENSVKVCNALNRKGYHTVNVLGGYESWMLEK